MHRTVSISTHTHDYSTVDERCVYVFSESFSYINLLVNVLILVLNRCVTLYDGTYWSMYMREVYVIFHEFLYVFGWCVLIWILFFILKHIFPFIEKIPVIFPLFPFSRWVEILYLYTCIRVRSIAPHEYVSTKPLYLSLSLPFMCERKIGRFILIIREKANDGRSGQNLLLPPVSDMCVHFY